MKLVTPRRRPNPLSSKMTMELLHGFIDDGGVEALNEFLALDGSEDSLIMYHHSLGRHIRNEYMHGTNFMDEYPDEHFDDVSFEIIMNLHSMFKSLKADGVDLLTFGRKKKGVDRVLEIMQENNKIDTSGTDFIHKDFDGYGYHN